MMDILIAILIVIGWTAAIVIAIILALWVIFSTVEVTENPRNLSEENFFIFLARPLKPVTKLPLLFHRPSPLQREIMQEEKEIKDLERKKADMKRLDQLRERKEELFEEVAAEEVNPYTIDPSPTLRNEHYRWCVVCDSYFSGNHCDCLEDEEVRAYTPEQTANILDNGVTMEEAIENHNKAMKNLWN